MAIEKDLRSLRDQYEEAGYVVVHNLITVEEARQLKEEIRRILDRVRAEAKAAGKDPQEVLKSGALVGLARRSATFQGLAKDPRILDVLEQIIGPNIGILSDKIVFKDSDTEFGTPFHQDWPY